MDPWKFFGTEGLLEIRNGTLEVIAELGGNIFGDRRHNHQLPLEHRQFVGVFLALREGPRWGHA